MKLNFYGGTGEATGANYILESAGKRIMVDCGLHQGGHAAAEKNFEPFPYDAKSVSAVFITHSHLDHIGRLPSLVKAGFKGTIYSTHATKDFAELMLLDSEHILASEAEHKAQAPTLSNEDIGHVMSLWHGLNYHEMVSVEGFNVQLFDAGHILGSAIVKVVVNEGSTSQGSGGASKTIVFSGDLAILPRGLSSQPKPLTPRIIA